LFIPQGKVVRLAGDFFVLRQARNPGAAFGILQGALPFFMIISAAVIVAAVGAYLLWARDKPRFYAVGLGLICAGAIGNIVDRVVFGKVIDFIGFSFWPTFNIADIAIMAGMVTVMAAMVKETAKNPTGGA